MCVCIPTPQQRRKFLSDLRLNQTIVVTSPKYSTTWKILIILICRKYMCCPPLTPNQLSRLGRSVYNFKGQPRPAHAECVENPGVTVSPWQGCRAQAEAAWLLGVKTGGKSSLVSSLRHTIH